MRRYRIEVAGVPMHVVQRGIDRARVFRDDDDRQHYLVDLHACASAESVALHGYVLMDNHVHLLMSSPIAGGVSRALRALGSRFVRRYNSRHGRTGPLWEGRFRSSVIADDRYLFRCLAYIELNPVRAGMTRTAETFLWSSARHHLGLHRDPFVDPHPTFVALAAEPAARHVAWRAILDHGIGRIELERIREHFRQERVYGPGDFQEQISVLTGRSVKVTSRGRPRTRA
jgi:putative transposase